MHTYSTVPSLVKKDIINIQANLNGKVQTTLYSQDKILETIFLGHFDKNKQTHKISWGRRKNPQSLLRRPEGLNIMADNGVKGNMTVILGP